MGFYGDITDRRQVIFQFDKVFNNRRSMDELALSGKDGVFAGRFVLVKYDPEGKFFEGDINLGYIRNNIIYMDENFLYPYTFTTLHKVNNPIIDDVNLYYQYNGDYYFKVPNSNYFNPEINDYYVADNPSNSAVFLNQLIRIFDEEKGAIQTYYKCTGSITGESGALATWQLVNHNDTNSDYLKNYNIDKATYASNFDVRGYDATVWEKVYNGGQGKFILIAYLNGIMPGLELYPDPPTVYPNAPYIDALSSDSLYRIHVPSMFGFQLKPIDINDPKETFISDQTGPVVNIEYDNLTKEYKKTTESTNVAVYFNKQASDYQIRHTDTTTTNEILLEPSGKSGRVYYDTDGNEITDDIMELSIKLPIIGNVVSEGYDLIYGSGENNRPRLINTSWVDGNASENEKYFGSDNLKTHDLNTMAGTLNNMHDILGQIVVELNEKPTPQFVQDNLLENLIYKIEDEYYRVGTDYKIEIIDDETTYFNIETQSEDYMLSVDPVSYVSEAEYIGNKYLIYDQESFSFIPAAGEYNPSLANGGYYLRTITGARYQPIELIQFNQSQYYYKDGVNYIRDNSTDFPRFPEREYYDPEVSQSYTFLQEYVRNRFYTKIDRDYILSTAVEPIGDTNYYEILNRFVSQTINSEIFYYPGFYYIYDTNTNKYVISNDDFDEHTVYYNIVYSTELKQGVDEHNQPILYYKVDSFESLDPAKGEIHNLPTNINDYYYLDGTNFISWISLKDKPHEAGKKHPITINRTYYIIPSEALNTYQDNQLYIRNKYYRYDDVTGDYIKAVGPLQESSSYYLILNENMLQHPFYLIDKYYYKIPGTTDEFKKSSTTRMTIKTQNPLTYITYYTKKELYVYSDSSGQCPHGYAWNDFIKYIPPSITLYYKTDFINLIPLPGLANADSSIFGQALAINKMFGINDAETRDINTMRGAFNVLKDLLYMIKTLKPGRLLYVNEFGQIESTDESLTIDTLRSH